MSMLRRWFWACAFVATVLVAALSHDAVVWAQGYGGVGFPGGGGRGIGLLNSLYCQLASPCVLTGDNSGGTGTLRIRPSDEDTQLVLCEAGNNASPEVCSPHQHINFSTTVSYGINSTNSYVDSGGGFNRYNTAFGAARSYTQASSTQASNTWVADVFSTNGTQSGNVALTVSGAGTATFSTGTAGTVTNDFRGPITNGGSATCNGYNAGSVCMTDTVAASAANSAILIHSTNATGYSSLQLMNNSGTTVGNYAHYGASYSDADYADKVANVAVGKTIAQARTDDVAAGTAGFEWMDNGSGTGVVLMDVLGNGTVRPLLYGSQSNCSDGAGAAACTAAPAGSVVVDDGATTVVVSTTAVTANSQILLTYDSSLGTKLGVTCNTNIVQPTVSARTAATSFTITISADPATANPACISYFIVN